MSTDSPPRFLAVDLGAESGRVVVATLNEGRLQLEEIHRFKNGAREILGTLRWDLLGLWSETRAGLKKALGAYPEIKSLSVDSWGVDYVLVRRGEPMLGLSFHYRDPRSGGPFRRLREDPGEPYIYQRTGIQFMTLNSLYQLVADHERDPEWVATADGFLMIADWFHWLLTGRRAVEETNASTTQLYDPIRRTWSWELIERLGLPRTLFRGEVVTPGTVIGPLAKALCAGRTAPSVIACCTHDTGSAVVAVPADAEEGWAYLSSGTWSLIGVELPAPLLTEEARRANFTNELGYAGTVRFLKNIIGLWLLQECRRHWAEAGDSWTMTN